MRYTRRLVRRAEDKSRLRTDAENLLSKTPGDLPVLPEKNHETIFHELQVHQIELELQNEELKKAHQNLELSRDRYVDLYDFAPVGYVTLTKEALIAEVNLTGAAMLGVVRGKLLQDRFRRFVPLQHQDLWLSFFSRILHQDEDQICELVLTRKDGTDFTAYFRESGYKLMTDYSRSVS